ncbi:MAG: methionyl-tRNA formyltransferase, partial [Clostridia bacterium]|nr:methionyl-tRNA formyltransferase [Clostridia bacterium]
MRIVFMGTPEFAVEPLKELIRNGYEIAGVFTQPDRPKGRGKKPAPSPVKIAAEEACVPVFQPERIRKNGVEDLKKLKPDLCVTAAFGQILSQEILDIPPLGNINVHASLLPKHRGAAPIAYAIMNGDRKAGVTTMFMDA